MEQQQEKSRFCPFPPIASLSRGAPALQTHGAGFWLWLAAALILNALLYTWYLLHTTSVGWDWTYTHYQAVQAVLHGGDPYAVPTFFNPVWVSYILVPFALMGEFAGRLALFAASLMIFAALAWRFGANARATFALLMSPLVFWSASSGNIDALALAGLLLPAPIGLFLVMLKPQLGIPIALYWLVQAWKSGGVRRVIGTFAPVSIALIWNFLAYGVVYGNHSVAGPDPQWNAAVFPYLVPFGLFLMWRAFRQGQIEKAAGAGPLLSPYVSLTSPVAVQLAFVRSEAGMWITTVAVWVLYLLSILLYQN